MSASSPAEGMLVRLRLAITFQPVPLRLRNVVKTISRILLHRHGNSGKFPDIAGVFRDRAIAGEFADACGIEDCHFGPARLVEESGGDELLGVAVRFEIREAEERIVVDQIVAERAQNAGGLVRSKEV